MSKGFSLIELLISLAIISILLVISYPLYTQHIMASHRHSAEVALMNVATQLENYYSINNTYEDANFNGLHVASITESGAYQLFIQTMDSQHYLITANPTGTQQQDICGSLSLDSDGNKLSGGNVSNCW